MIAKHIAKYPNEQTPLKDTSPSSGWHTRTPTNTPIHPIGHIAIVLPPPEELLPLGLPPKGVAYISKLYVSYALQAHGFGGAAMREVETIAREQLGCEVAYLDTVPAEYQMRPETLEEFYGARGNPVPKVSQHCSFFFSFLFFFGQFLRDLFLFSLGREIIGRRGREKSANRGRIGIE
jgi:hypothetical protein